MVDLIGQCGCTSMLPSGSCWGWGWSNLDLLSPRVVCGAKWTPAAHSQRHARLAWHQPLHVQSASSASPGRGASKNSCQPPTQGGPTYTRPVIRTSDSHPMAHGVPGAMRPGSMPCRAVNQSLSREWERGRASLSHFFHGTVTPLCTVERWHFGRCLALGNWNSSWETVQVINDSSLGVLG